MNKSYNRINWENEPSENTPINEANLNKMDYSINEIDNRVIQIDVSKGNQTDLLQCYSSIEYDTETGIFIFTKMNGSTVQVDLNIEKIPVSFSMSDSGVITMTNTDGTSYTADIGALIKTYVFEDSEQIDFTCTLQSDGTYNVKGIIKDGSITESMIDSEYLANIAMMSAQSTQNAQTATEYGNLSKSYSVGSTGTRAGEDSDNAMYYAQKAQECKDNVISEINDAFEANVPKFQIDLTNGHMYYEGGRTYFTVDNSNGHLLWEVAV